MKIVSRTHSCQALNRQILEKKKIVKIVKGAKGNRQKIVTKNYKVKNKIIVKHLINRIRYNIKVEAVTIANF